MYDCQSCGACCSHKWSWPVLKKDRSDAGNIPNDLVREEYPLMKTIGNRCTALIGSVGSFTACSIYHDRPSACRKFKAGSDLCKEARVAAGLNT
jgi:Fe-S-cluster containining protein